MTLTERLDLHVVYIALATFFVAIVTVIVIGEPRIAWTCVIGPTVVPQCIILPHAFDRRGKNGEASRYLLVNEGFLTLFWVVGLLIWINVKVVLAWT